jgi:hypothetical protein
MGGSTFDKTNKLNQEEYFQLVNFVKQSVLIENIDYLLPFRLCNKDTYGDVDFVLADSEKFIKVIKVIEKNNLEEYKIIETKKIPLFEERFGLYSLHLLTSKFHQIDLLKSWNQDSIEITRAYFSYSFANIFFKRLMDFVDRNLKFSYLGVFCSSNKFIIPPDIKFIQIDDKTKLIIDCEYVFNLMDLDYLRYTQGFANEIELLEYLKTSKYYTQIKFKNNSKFKHDYSRLKPFANLVDLGLISVENFIKIN